MRHVASVCMIIRVYCKTLVLCPTTRNARAGSESTIHPKLTGRRWARAAISLKALAGRLVTTSPLLIRGAPCASENAWGPMDDHQFGSSNRQVGGGILPSGILESRSFFVQQNLPKRLGLVVRTAPAIGQKRFNFPFLMAVVKQVRSRRYTTSRRMRVGEIRFEETDVGRGIERHSSGKFQLLRSTIHHTS
jgi:hypothetical protein